MRRGKEEGGEEGGKRNSRIVQGEFARVGSEEEGGVRKEEEVSDASREKRRGE